MLTELSISNLGIIEDETVELAAGLTVISGETGAGKSMLLSALNLLTGGRASATSVSEGATQLSVDSHWDLGSSASPRLLQELENLSGELEEGELTLSRTVKADGKSRAIVAGRPATAKVLGTVAAELLSIHGQSDQLKLRDGSAQMKILDGYGLRSKEAKAAFLAYGEAYGLWKKALETLREVKSNAAAKRREVSGLRKFIDDYEEIDPQPNEIEELEQLISRLKNHEEISSQLAVANSLFSEIDTPPQGVVEEIASALRKASRYSSELEALHELAEDVCSRLSELESAVEREIDRSDGEALEELAEAQGRLLELQALLKRSGVEDLEALEEEVLESRRALEALEVYDRPLEELEAEVAVARSALETRAEKLTTQRTKAAKELSLKVNDELSGLAMSATVFAIEVSPVEPNGRGMDEISFTIRQSGQKPQPIGSTASGGELSRIMLALELSLAAHSHRKTFVFDEVDSGVGGKTALEIGKRLAELGLHHQVIVVSHLAQVAAYAERNLKVVKTDDGTAVRTTVELVSEEDRPREIARMLSGVADSQSALEHSRELLESAELLRSKH